MPHLLSLYPTIRYKLDGVERTITDLSIRLRIRELTKNSIVSYFDYYVGEGEKPWMVADRFYEDPTLDWLVMMVNDVIDPIYDWPLSNAEFKEFLKKKYGSLQETYTKVHHREWITQRGSVSPNGTVVPEKAVIIDEYTYLSGNIPASDKRAVTCYEYENDINEGKRRIQILERRFVPSLLASVSTILGQ